MINSWSKILSRTDLGLGGTHDEYLIHPGKYNYSYLFRFCDDVNKGLNDPIFYD